MGASLALHGGDIGGREMEEPRDAQTQNRLQSMMNVSTQRGSQQSSTRQQLLWLVICQDARRKTQDAGKKVSMMRDSPGGSPKMRVVLMSGGAPSDL